MQSTTRRLALAASAVLAIAASGGAALAQTPPTPPAAPLPPLPPLPPMDVLMGGHNMAMMMHGKPRDPEAHAKHLRDVLQLRPDQDAALKTYLDATAPKMMAEGMVWESRNDDGDDDKPLTTPERLDKQAAHMAKMAEAFQKRSSATKTFYAALSPSQQKAFDALGPHAGGPRMRIQHLDIRHNGPPMGEGKDERKIIMKRQAGR